MAKCTGVRCPMQYGYKIEECNQTDCPYRTEPMTNADRIRTMSDEELAALLNKIVVNHHIKNADNCNHCPMKGATPCDTEGIIGWLKRPADGEVVCTADLIEKEYSGSLEE